MLRQTFFLIDTPLASALYVQMLLHIQTYIEMLHYTLYMDIITQYIYHKATKNY